MRWSILLLGGLLAACGPSLDDVLTEHGEAGRARLARLDRVLEACRTSGRLEVDVLPESLPGVVFHDPHDRPDGNARTLWLDAHDDPATWLDPLHPSYRAYEDWWRRTEAALSSSPPDLDRRGLERLVESFGALAATDYVLVVRTHEYTAPRHLPDTDRYTMGKMSGEAHLHRLADGERLASILFEAYGQVIGAAGFDFALGSSDPAENVLSLKERLYGTIRDFAEARLAGRVPGVEAEHEIVEGGPFETPKLRRREATE
jgi:hypothetical protein